MKLLTQSQYTTLLDNGRKQAIVKGTVDEIDFYPVVKLFYPAGAATWLITELDPDDEDIDWGLCDLGMGEAEYGAISLSELRGLKSALGLGIERDRTWTARAPVYAYIDAALKAGRIVDVPRAEPEQIASCAAPGSENSQQ